MNDEMTTILTGDCRDILPTLQPESVHSIVTDPPYGLSFMGKGWDHGVPGVEFWVEALRVLKPGGYLLAFGGTRTYHRLAVAIEDAGFEIRDCLSWLYGSGFPKSHDVSKAIDKAAGAEREIVGKQVLTGTAAIDGKTGRASVYAEGRDSIGAIKTINLTAPATPEAQQWEGWGTALKPGWEPIIMARKPLIGTVAANVLEHGTGAINVDACRIGTDGGTKRTHQAEYPRTDNGKEDRSQHWARTGHGIDDIGAGRWPANVVLDEDAAAMLDAQSRVSKSTGGQASLGAPSSRFFYCAKASRSERGEGNTHPTVKPIALMRWLVRMVTPPGGTVLDPFMGSGTTGVAASLEEFEFIGIERDEGYAEIARNRLAPPGV